VVKTFLGEVAGLISHLLVPLRLVEVTGQTCPKSAGQTAATKTGSRSAVIAKL